MVNPQDSIGQLQMEQVIAEFLALCTKKKEFVGLSLVSNQARRSSRAADGSSDIDLELYISVPQITQLKVRSKRDFLDKVQPWLPDWLPYFDFIAPALDGIEVNIFQRIIEYDERLETKFTETRREAYASGFDLLYDPAGRIAKVIAKNLRWYPGEKEAKIALRLARACWDAEAAITQAERTQIFAAHSLLNVVIENLLCSACYLGNTFPPSSKWLWNVARSLPVLSKEDVQALEAAIIIRDLSKEDVLRRHELLSNPLIRLYRKGELVLGMDPGDFYNSRVSIDRQLRFSGHEGKGWDFKSSARGHASWFLTGQGLDVTNKNEDKF